MTSLFIFRRDLRLHDNTGLHAALAKGDVMAAFIFDPAQLEHPYFSRNGFRFLLNSLLELDEELRKRNSSLYVFKGDPTEVLVHICEKHQIDAVFVNRDYTPFANRRDASLAGACRRMSIPFTAYADALLHEPEQVTKSDQTPYTIFTPFWRAARGIPVRGVSMMPKRASFAAPQKEQRIIKEFLDSCSDAAAEPAVHGGRKEALALLQRATTLRQYEQVRDIPGDDATTHLSAHLKFGTLSVREAYHALDQKLGPDHPLLRQLHWRDFFTHIAHHFPHVFGHAFHRKYDQIAWSRSAEPFNAWREGRTGFPIIDAGMRELLRTGSMHNRARMIVASFLVKDLHIDWRKGEQHFAQHLIDYDPCVNNGNWQWAASTGCDAQPYFRIFNPWLQQQRFDPECAYIKKWVPELRDLPPRAIHLLHQNRPLGCDYPAPIVEHRAESEKAKAAFAGVR